MILKVCGNLSLDLIDKGIIMAYLGRGTLNDVLTEMDYV
jgi:hypothetical protein